MRAIIILLLCLCQLSLKAHDHSTSPAKHNDAGHVQLHDQKENTHFDRQHQISEAKEYLTIQEDEDDNATSARKYVLLAKSPLVHFLLPALLDFYPSINSSIQYCCQASHTHANKYITQRVLRI
ncbi:MAG: hypothetical protein EOO03_08775 [Chitinophagaceae bacterium]|nr:MAG: hypothetical protein EOO03_08775 [Chitinophagaceae bacterium]